MYHVQIWGESPVPPPGVEGGVQAGDLVPGTVEIIRHQVDKIDDAEI